MLEPPLSENCKGLTMKLEVKYIFGLPARFSVLFFHQMPEGLKTRNILPNGIKMEKNPPTRADIFWIFTDFQRVVWIQIPSCTAILNLDSIWFFQVIDLTFFYGKKLSKFTRIFFLLLSNYEL